MKKGFTIVELLIVIIIIALISLLTVPAVRTMINNSEEKAYKMQIKSITDAANSFIEDYLDVLPISDHYTIDLKLLKDLAYVEYEIKNPRNNTYFSDKSLITFTKKVNIYKAEFYPEEYKEITPNTKYDQYILLLKGSNPCMEDCGLKSNLIILDINGQPQEISENDISLTEEATEGEYKTTTYSVILNNKTYFLSRLEP